MATTIPLDPEQVEKLRLMTMQGHTIADIAAAIGCTARTVSRWRTRLGLTKPLAPPWTDEQDRLARNLLQDGCPYREVARTVHHDYKSVMYRFPDYPTTAHNPIAGMHAIAERLGLTLT
jgi:DNA invertase Pin-like site-specific DNA recombinase